MSKLSSIFLPATLALLTSLPATAQVTMPEPGWSLPMARAAAGQVDVQAELKPLFHLAREGKNDQLLQNLIAIESRADWPAPAREQVLHSFATGLGDLQAWSVSNDVIDLLLSYQPLTIVPHSDHAGHGVPLFNIRSATMGAVNQWRRQTAFARSYQLFEQGSQAWLDAYLSASPQQKKGYRDALETSTRVLLMELGPLSLQQISRDASLAVVAAKSGLLLSDAHLFQQALSATRGPELAGLIRMASTTFSDQENFDLLVYSIKNAPPGTAALAVAILTPDRLDQHNFTELTFQVLEHQELGSAAALVLASGTSPDIQQRLARLAARKDSLASKRAALAVSQTANEGDSR